MKNLLLYVLGLLSVVLTMVSCSTDDVVPTSPMILGEWTAAEGQFLTLNVDGEEMSKSAFGIEVLRASEAEAETAAIEYLQNNFLGPIDINAPWLVFTPNNHLVAALAGTQITANWELHNDGQILDLHTPDLSARDFDFKIKKLAADELILYSDWEMSYLGENRDPFQVTMTISLVK